MTLNVPVLPVTIVTVAGYETEPESAEMEMTTPLGGTEPLRVIVALDVPPLATVAGAKTIEAILGARIIIVPVTVVPFDVPVTVTVSSVPTSFVVKEKVTEVLPPSTLTVAGMVALAEFFARVTTMPAAAAGPLRVTVPVEASPPVTAEGLNVMEATTGGKMPRVAVWLTAPAAAVTVAVVFAATIDVVTVNVPLVAPAATVTLAGTCADALFDEVVTEKPPAGAGPVRVSVPVLDAPPVTCVGFSASVLSFGAWITSGWLAELAAKLAVMDAVTSAGVAVVETVKVAVVEPAATVTDAGAVALPLFEARVTLIPPVGALPLRVTVPVELLPPITVVGLRPSVVTVGARTVSGPTAEPPFAVAVA